MTDKQPVLSSRKGVGSKSSALSVFDFPSFGDFLTAFVQEKKQKDSNFSFTVLARLLKVRSPSLLAMIARGERFPQLDLLAKISEYIKLSEAEAAYVDALVGFQKSKDPATKEKFAERLRILNPSNDRVVLELDAFSYIAQWHHLSILELTNLPHFVESTEVISQWLGTTVSPDMVAQSLELLQRLGLLQRDDSGRLRRTVKILKTPTNIPSASVRLFHKQMMMRAHQAIDRQSVEERIFLGLTIPIAQENLNSAHKRIREFWDAFASEFYQKSSAPDEVYHLGVHLFRVSDSKVKSETKNSG